MIKKKSSAKEDHLLSKSYMIVLLNSIDRQGRNIYAYVAINGKNLEKFREEMRKDFFQPAKYGKILAHGVGEPDEKVKKEMTEKYGFRHDSPAKFASDDID